MDATAPLISGSVLRSDDQKAKDEAEKQQTVLNAAWGGTSSFGNGPAYPPLDPANSWFGILLFYTWMIPLPAYFVYVYLGPWALAIQLAPLTLVLMCLFVPFMFRLALFFYIQVYAQITLPFQPANSCCEQLRKFAASVLLIPLVHVGFLSAFLYCIVLQGPVRFLWWDALSKVQGGLKHFLFGEGIFYLEYDKVRSLCSSNQKRGPYMGASILACPRVIGKHILLFIDGEEHKAFRSTLITHLLSPSVYEPRVAELPRVLAPLLPSPANLDAFVKTSGESDEVLLSKMVARCLWFLVFGEAGLLEPGEELDTVAAWYSLPKPMVFPRMLDRLAFGAIGGKVLAGRKAVVELIHKKGLASLFREMNGGLPASYRAPTDAKLCDDLMVAINFAGVNGTVQLLRSTLAALRRATYEAPAESIVYPPDNLVNLFKSNPNGFLLETCRLDPPVTSACCLLKQEEEVEVAAVCCGTKKASFKEGTAQQYVFGGSFGPNRDPTKFKEPNHFNPARTDIGNMLSWNGALEDPAAFPRFCPGQKLSMIMCRAVLSSIVELQGAKWPNEAV